MPFVKINTILSQEEAEELLFCFNISSDRHDGDRGLTGMIKLTEIAVKSMSPGINDPGTAISAINKIGQLLNTTLQFSELNTEKVQRHHLHVTKHSISAPELMRILIQPIRLYSKKDNSVCYVLLKSLLFIHKNTAISSKNKSLITMELNALKFDIQENISNQYDKNGLLDLFATEN